MTSGFWSVSGLFSLVFFATGSIRLARTREQLVAGGMVFATI